MHRFNHPEIGLDITLGRSLTAVDAGFERGVVGLDELTGVAAALRCSGSANAAIGAEIAVRRVGRLRRDQGQFSSPSMCSATRSRISSEIWPCGGMLGKSGRLRTGLAT